MEYSPLTSPLTNPIAEDQPVSSGLMFLLGLASGAVIVSAAFIILNLGPTLKAGVNRWVPEINNSLNRSVNPANNMIKTVASPGIKLMIIDPQNGQIVTSSKAGIKGITTARADIFVNDQQATADDQGQFNVQVALEEGNNYFSIVANDDQGQYAETELLIIYEPNNQQ